MSKDERKFQIGDKVMFKVGDIREATGVIVGYSINNCGHNYMVKLEGNDYAEEISSSWLRLITPLESLL